MKIKKVDKIKIKTIGLCKKPYYDTGSKLGINLSIPSRIYLVNHEHKPSDNGGVRVSIDNLVFPPNSYTLLPMGVIINHPVLLYSVECVTNLRISNYIYEGNGENELMLAIHNTSNIAEHWRYESPIVKFIPLSQTYLELEEII